MDRIAVDVAHLRHAVSLDNPLNQDRMASLYARTLLESLPLHGVELACFWTPEGYVLQGRVGEDVVESDPVPLANQVESAVRLLAEQLLDRCVPLIEDRDRAAQGGV